MPHDLNDPLRLRSRNVRYFLLGALALVFFKNLIGLAPSGRDLVLQYLPYQELVRNAIRSGEMPYWNAMTFCGRPLMADIQVGVLYPPNWLHWFLPLPLSFTILLLGHAGLALWGAYRLGRAWGMREPAALWMAVLYAFSGFLTLKLQAGVVLFLYVAAWAPWAAVMLMALLRVPSLPRAIALALVLALSLLAGSPQMTFFVWGLLVLFAALLIAIKPRHGDWGVGRAKAAGLVAFAFALALALTAIQTFQTQQMTAVSFDRGENSDPEKAYNYFTEGSLNPWLLLLEVNPGFFGPGHDELAYAGGGLGFSEACAYIPVAAWWLLIPAGKLMFLPRPRRRRNKIGADADGTNPLDADPESDPESASDAEARRLRLALFWGGLFVALFGVLMASGRASLLYDFFYNHVPGFNLFRVPARYLFFFNVGAAVSSALALDAWLGANASAGSPTPRTSRRSALNPAAARAAGWWIMVAIPIGAFALGFTAFGLERALNSFQIPGLAAFLKSAAAATGSTMTLERRASLANAAFQGIFFLCLNGGALALIGRLGSWPAALTLPGDQTDPARAKAIRAADALAWTLPALAALELALLSWPSQPATPIGRFRAEHYPQTQLTQTLRQIHAAPPAGGRVLWTDTLLDWRVDQNSPEVLTNALIMQGLPDSRGYDPVNARWIASWFNRLAGLPPETNPRGYMWAPRPANPGLLAPMGVKTVLTYETLPPETGLAQAAQLDFPEGALRVYVNRAFRGMAFAAPLPPAPPLPMSRDEAQEITLQKFAANPQADPITNLVYDENIPPAPDMSASDASSPAGPAPAAPRVGPDHRISPVRERGNKFIYDVSFPAPAALCLAQSAYPGWSVKIDNAYAPLSTASGTFLATAVPAGDHRVEFEYAPPPGYEYARLLTLAAAAFTAYTLARAAWRSRRRRIKMDFA